jgi:ferredoxin-NADP reductase
VHGFGSALLDTLASTPVSSATLAAFSTIHLSLALLRKHRGVPGSSLLLIPFFATPVLPWLFPGSLFLGALLVAHLASFAICDRLRVTAAPARRPAAAPVRPASSAPRAVSAAASFIAAPVLAVLQETHDIRTFRVRRPEAFEFRAGQFLSVRIQIDGHTLVRCYTISSSPEARGYIEITVKRQGVVSGILHSAIRPGSTLTIRGPSGRFVYPEDDERPVVLLGGGVGATPLMSMLRHATASDPGRSVIFLLSVRTEQDVLFRDELATIARRHPQVRIVVGITRDCRHPGFYPGRIDEKLIGQTVSDPAHALFYMCGPLPMIASMKEILARLGVPGTQMRAEAFEAATAKAEALQSAPRAPAGAGGRRSFHLALSRSGRATEVAATQTLLEAAEAAGAEIPNSCRGGTCRTCVTRLVRGNVHCESEMLEPQEREEGFVLPCVSFARSDCEIEA